MSNFKKMTLKNVELINIYAYINRTEKVIDKKGNVEKDENGNEKTYSPTFELIKNFNTKAKWAFRVNLKKIEEANKLYEEALREFQSEYADDEHSTEEVMRDEKGNPVKNEQGEEIKTRTVKKEYFDEFQNKYQELLVQENEINFKLITIDDIEDANPSFADLEMLSFMIDDEDE